MANFTGNTEFFLTVNKINAIDKQIGENELEIEKIKYKASILLKPLKDPKIKLN